MSYSRYKKNKNFLSNNQAYDQSLEHDACGVGMVAATDGKKSRQVIDYGIQALKAVWHRGAVDADGKSGDGAGIKIEVSPNFFLEKIEETGHKHSEDKRICVGMIFLPKNDYSAQEKCKAIVENILVQENFYIYGWRQVPVNPKVLGVTANSNRPEITQVLFRKNSSLETDILERQLFVCRKKIEKEARENQLKEF